MSEASSLHVLIVGAGTGGLCLAQGLKKNGISVSVYERDRTRTDVLQGYRLAISGGGTRALHECLSPVLFQTFLATTARPLLNFNRLTEQLSELLSLSRPKPGPDEIVDPLKHDHGISRITLRQILLTELDEIVSYDKKFTRYEQHDNGKVTAFFEDGTSATGDVLIGADGTKSHVCGQLLPSARLLETGIYSFGGKVLITEETKALLPPKVFCGVTVFDGPKGYGAITQVMDLKWDETGIKPDVSKKDAETIASWPGLKYDNTPPDYIMWGFWAPRFAFPQDCMSMDGEQIIRVVLELTQGWHPNMRKLIGATVPSSIISIKFRASEAVSPWPTSNVTVLGDAIHTMPPGLGLGANTALKDAGLLCKQLLRVRDGSIPLIEALHEYEAEMLQYGTRNVRASSAKMDEHHPIYKPVIGPMLTALERTGLRIVQRSPRLKRRMGEWMGRLRQ